MTSCQSVKVVYVTKYITPDYDMPIFPKLEREVQKDGSWYMPKESTDLLAEFYVNYDLLVKLYNHDKELFDKLKDNSNEE